MGGAIYNAKGWANQRTNSCCLSSRVLAFEAFSARQRALNGSVLLRDGIPNLDTAFLR